MLGGIIGHHIPFCRAVLGAHFGVSRVPNPSPPAPLRVCMILGKKQARPGHEQPITGEASRRLHAPCCADLVAAGKTQDQRGPKKEGSS